MKKTIILTALLAAVIFEASLITLVFHAGVPSGRIGEEVKVKTPVTLISVKVNSWQVNSTITYPSCPSGQSRTDLPRAGYKFLVLNITSKNYGPEKMIYTLPMKLTVDKGYIYEDCKAYSETNMNNPTIFTLKDVLPNEVEDGARAFEIPADSNPSKLTIYVTVNTETRILLVIDFKEKTE